MDIIIEIFFDLLLEGSIELSTNKKVPKWIRYPLIMVMLFLLAIVIYGLFYSGLVQINKNFFFGAILILIGLALVIGIVFKIIKEYNIRRK